MIHTPIRILSEGKYLVIDSSYLDHNAIDYNRSIDLVAVHQGNRLIRHLLRKRSGGAVHGYLAFNTVGDVSGVDLVSDKGEKDASSTIRIQAPSDTGHHVFIDLSKHPEALDWLPQDKTLFDIIDVQEAIPSPALYGHFPNISTEATQQCTPSTLQRIFKAFHTFIGITAGFAGALLFLESQIKEGLLGLTTALRF